MGLEVTGVPVAEVLAKSVKVTPVTWLGPLLQTWPEKPTTTWAEVFRLVLHDLVTLSEVLTDVEQVA